MLNHYGHISRDEVKFTWREKVAVFEGNKLNWHNYIPFFYSEYPDTVLQRKWMKLKFSFYFLTDQNKIKSEEINTEKDNFDPSTSWFFYRILPQQILHCKVSVNSDLNLFEVITEVVFKIQFKLRHRNH